MKTKHVMLMLCTMVIAIPLVYVSVSHIDVMQSLLDIESWTPHMFTVKSISEGPEGQDKWHKEIPLKEQKVTRLHFFLHDVFAPPGQTGYPVYTSNITSTSISNFGLGVIFDDPLTEEADINSTLIGRGQGLASSASMSETRFLTLINFVFTQGSLNGSTLQVFGTNPLQNSVRELSVIGGTGIFQLARGSATFSNYTTSQSIREYNIEVLHSGPDESGADVAFGKDIHLYILGFYMLVVFYF